jgi:hypothetical protein
VLPHQPSLTGYQPSGFVGVRLIKRTLGQLFSHRGPCFCRALGSSASSTAPRRITLSPLRFIRTAKGHYVSPQARARSPQYCDHRTTSARSAWISGEAASSP